MSDPLFPFGFGKSYTTFSIGTAKLGRSEIKRGESVSLTIPVANTGKRDGTEIVQVYVRKVNDINGPFRTLRGFKRVKVAAGKTGQATIELPPTAFEYEVWYGNSSDAKDLKSSTIVLQ